MRSLIRFIIASLLATLPQAASARDGEGWVVSWTGSVQGPYPVGNPSAQPDQKFAFPDPAIGANAKTKFPSPSFGKFLRMSPRIFGARTPCMPR